MIVSINESREFIPLWKGNRDEPKSEQIRFEHKTPTVAIKDRLNPQVFEFKDGGVSGSFTVDRRKCFDVMVTAIHNLGYTKDGVEYKVATVDQLFNAPTVFTSLVDEVYNHFQEILNDKVDEKN